MTVADWIGSDEDFFPPDHITPPNAVTAKAHAAVVACGLEIPILRSDLDFLNIFDFQPNELQNALSDLATLPGLYVVEAPMGSGKTEAALYAAYRLITAGHHRGLFFGLPTRLTSDRIHTRVQSFLDRITVTPATAKLAHGMAWLRPYVAHGGDEMLPGHAWSDPAKRRLLHPFAVGTIDQALMSVVRVKHYFVRSYALANKVVILDEVHSYDTYTSTLLARLVQHLLALDCTVIVLSATLSSGRRAVLAPALTSTTSRQDYPLIARQTAAGVDATPVAPPLPRTYHVRMAAWAPNEVAAAAVAAARQGQCVLCVANTVAMAQNWFDIARSERKDGDPEIGLLHARFPAYRRQEIEDIWLARLGKPPARRPVGCVLIATQVVEQSVDIDADLLITELAPTDMLLQRMGRQWRHERGQRPTPAPETIIVAGDTTGATDKDAFVSALGKANCLVYAP